MVKESDEMNSFIKTYLTSNRPFLEISDDVMSLIDYITFFSCCGDV